MGILRSSPNPVSVWRWTIEIGSIDPVLPVAIEHSVNLAGVLGGNGVFVPHSLEIEWSSDGLHLHRETSKVLAVSGISIDVLTERVKYSHPVGTSEANPCNLIFYGIGDWLTFDGDEREEFGLLELYVSIKENSIAVEIRTHFDIWADRDFFGNPHPEIYEQNAPRLAASLQAVEDALGAPATPGEPTFFGTPYNYGVRVHKTADGSGIDVSDHL